MDNGRMTEENLAAVPVLRQVVLDTTDVRTLAEFYRQLLGFAYRPGDEPPPAGEDDERVATGSPFFRPTVLLASPSNK